MCSSTFSKCIGIIISVIVGTASGILMFFEFITNITAFALPFIIIFSAVVALFMLTANLISSCNRDCMRLRRAICADRGFVIGTAVATLVAAIFTIVLSPTTAFVLSTILFGIVMFLFTLMLTAMFCFSDSFCNHRERCECKNDDDRDEIF